MFSGVWHPDVDGGHPADNCFLTAAPHPGDGGFRNTISLDQFAAERIGHLTRFPSLTLGVNVAQGSRSLSWTGGGALIPCEEKPSDVFSRLFLRGSEQEVAEQERRLRWARASWTPSPGRPSLRAIVGPHDRERLDQYFTGVRDLEQRLGKAREWERKPKPVVKVEPPARPGQPARVHGKGAADVRHGAAGVRDRQHAPDHPDARQRELADHRGRRRGDHRRLPQPLASRKIREEARPARGDRPGAHDACSTDLFTQLKAIEEKGRRCSIAA